MRHTVILASAALLTALLAIWGASTIIAKQHKGADAAPAAAATDVMQMMKNARDLPEQQFDAH